MAYVNNGTVVSLNYQLIPTGWTQSSVTKFDTAGEPNYARVLDVDMSNAVSDRANTLDAIIAEIESQVDTIVKADFDESANDVTVFTELYDINTNKVRSASNDFYTDATPVYECSVRIFVNVEVASI